MGWVGKKGILELGNMPEEVKRPHLKNGEVDSNVGDRF